jgi:hypothetical protein
MFATGPNAGQFGVIEHNSAPIVLRQNKAYWSFGRFFFDWKMIIG